MSGRVLVIQDISCVGRCSLTIALPVLSAMGLETAILPTAVLSTHTGGFTRPAVRHLEDFVAPCAAHWHREGVTFDAILVGYLGSETAVEAVCNCVRLLLAPGGILVVDPAMADNGKLYSGLTSEYAKHIKILCDMADLIVPNETEAILLHREQMEITGQNSVVTGIKAPNGQLNVRVYEQGSAAIISHDAVPGHFHGTGDLFAAVLTGMLLRKHTLYDAAQKASSFTCMAVQLAAKQQEPERFGLPFESLLPSLWEMIRKDS